jgi:hypothetical protein
MEYIQGFFNDSKTHYYESNMDFTMVVCNNIRYSEYRYVNDFNNDNHTYDINFSKGYIMCVKFFKDRFLGNDAYTYLEGFYNLEGVYTEVNQETIMSREFVFVNSKEGKEGKLGKLLVNVSKKMNRNKKIDLILE